MADVAHANLIASQRQAAAEAAYVNTAEAGVRVATRVPSLLVRRQRTLSYSSITPASRAGIREVSRKQVELGQLVAPGQPLLASSLTRASG